MVWQPRLGRSIWAKDWQISSAVMIYTGQPFTPGKYVTDLLSIGAFARQSFGQRVLVVVCSTWVVWIPAVAIIYSLPSALQVPLFNLVLCFWCLLMSFISRES